MEFRWNVSEQQNWTAAYAYVMYVYVSREYLVSTIQIGFSKYFSGARNKMLSICFSIFLLFFFFQCSWAIDD